MGGPGGPRHMWGAPTLYTLRLPLVTLCSTLGLRQDPRRGFHPTCTFVGCVSRPELWSEVVWRSLAGKMALKHGFGAIFRSSLGPVYVLSCPATNSSPGRARSLALSMTLSGVYREDP